MSRCSSETMARRYDMGGHSYVDAELFDSAIELLERCEKHARFPLPSADSKLYEAVITFLIDHSPARAKTSAFPAVQPTDSASGGKGDNTPPPGASNDPRGSST
jgi:hypothetical protein